MQCSSLVVNVTDDWSSAQTVESFYLMWRTTGNAVWRERGWEIFQAIEREAKTASGYASVKNVKQSPAPQSDEQPRYVAMCRGAGAGAPPERGLLC